MAFEKSCRAVFLHCADGQASEQALRVRPAPGNHPLALLKRYFDEGGAGAGRTVDRFQALLQSYLLNRAGRDLSPWRPQMAEEAACPGGAAVSVQSVERRQYRRWDYTFICGSVDGEFPPAEEFNFLQPGKDGLGPGSVYTGVDLARNRFYQLIRTTTEGLYLSCPRSYNGRRLPPSPLLKEAEKLLPRLAAGTVPDAPAQEQAQAIGGATLYSRREKLSAIAEKHTSRSVKRPAGGSRPWPSC